MREATTERLNSNAPLSQTTYYVRSGVLGGAVVAEVDGQGQRQKGYVYAGGARVVKQWQLTSSPKRGAVIVRVLP